MCGLVGIFGKIDKKEKEVFNQMLLFDAVRGEDSTGVYLLNTDEKEDAIIKAVGSPFELFDNKRYDKAMGLLNSYALLMGHNRAASRGSITKQNAHPFEFDNVVGTHNGTITNYYSLETVKYDTDSETVFGMINDKGIDTVIPNLLGSWSLVFWDKVNYTLNFIRNKERPLWYTITKDGANLLYASEKWMIEVAAKRSDLEINEPLETIVNHLYTFERKEDGRLGIHKLKELKGKEITVYQSFFTSNYTGFKTSFDKTDVYTEKGNIQTKKFFINEKPVDENAFRRLERRCNCSCGYCGSPLLANRLWIERGNIFCSEECLQSSHNLFLNY